MDANENSVEQACFLCQVYVLADLVDIKLITEQITLQNYESGISIGKPERLLFAILCDSHGQEKKKKRQLLKSKRLFLSVRM